MGEQGGVSTLNVAICRSCIIGWSFNQAGWKDLEWWLQYKETIHTIKLLHQMKYEIVN